MNGLENSRREGSDEGETSRRPHKIRNTPPLTEVQQGDYDDVAMRSVKVEVPQFDRKKDPKGFLK